MVIKNSISVDVEEYFHATNIEAVVPPANWHKMPSRVQASTETVLELFGRCKTKATFFILGYVARRNPRLIRQIAALGHEIASHGYSHRLVYNQQARAFYRDVLRTRRLLEDLTGQAVLGYRAPNFSITETSPWAYQELARAGYVYDSSIYPIKHPRYANTKRQIDAWIEPTGFGDIFVFPLAVTTLRLGSIELRMPVAGGAYWRLLPQLYTRWGLERLIRRENRSAHCYFHPWELDPMQPRFSQLSALTTFRHYGRTASFPPRLERLIHDFPFGTIRGCAEAVFGEHFINRALEAANA